jgi:hypothetical protein
LSGDIVDEELTERSMLWLLGGIGFREIRANGSVDGG